MHLKPPDAFSRFIVEPTCPLHPSTRRFQVHAQIGEKTRRPQIDATRLAVL